MSRLNLDRDKVESCRLSAKKIMSPLEEMLKRHSSVAVERASLLALGLEESLQGTPLVNLIVDNIPKDKLSLGACFWFGRALVASRSRSAISVALRLADKKIDLETLEAVPLEAIEKALAPLVKMKLDRLKTAHPSSDKGEPVLPENLGAKDPLAFPEWMIREGVKQNDCLASDPLHTILNTNLSPKRILIDHYFVRLLASASKTRFANTTSIDQESVRFYPQLLANHFLHYQFNLLGQLDDRQTVLTEPFFIDAEKEDSILYQIANAEMIREIFPRFSTLYQSDHRINPVILTLINKAASVLGSDLHWAANGRVIRKARATLEECYKILKKIESIGLTQALQTGVFLGTKITPSDHDGYAGIFKKDEHYFNPLLTQLRKTPDLLEVDFAPRPATEDTQTVASQTTGHRPESQRPTGQRPAGPRPAGHRSRGRGGSRGRSPKAPQAAQNKPAHPRSRRPSRGRQETKPVASPPKPSVA